MISFLLISAVSTLFLQVTTALPFPSNEAVPALEYCTKYPSWTVESFSSRTSDSVASASGGTANFTVVNNLTGVRDELSCSLQVNYRCILEGIPSDGNLTVHVAIRAGSLTFILDESVGGCPGRDTPLRVIGNTEFELDCSWDEHGGTVLCGLDKEGDNVIKGEAVELAPGGGIYSPGLSPEPPVEP
ncbi:hypothetical protein QBC43DRAFT_294608 [Cladorrhinum sp. PSN259]|nr:hypothetical protein QBC43DRAFT_294608 [Cladorrhinum sp. PSN259]